MSLLPVDEAASQLLELCEPTQRTELSSLTDALGRVLAADVVSGIDVPMVANSAMDGYAVRVGDTSSDVWIKLSDRIPAGSVGKTLEPGTAARIFTGAPTKCIC